MAITFKVKRASNAVNSTYTGQQGELTMQTDTTETTHPALRLHDGSTKGGFEIARSDLKNVKIPLGGVTFEYYWHGTEVTSHAHPTTASLGTNDTNFADDPLYLYLDGTDRNGVDLTNFLDKIGTISASIIGHFRVYKKDDATEFKIFSITNSEKYGDGTSGSPYYYRFKVEQLASSLTLADNEEIVISYISAGEDAINGYVTETYVLLDSTTEGTVSNSALSAGTSDANVYIGATQAQFKLPTAWSNATTYAVGDYVIHSNVHYKAKTAHTNSEPPNATNWDVVSDVNEYLKKDQYNIGTITHNPTGKLTVSTTRVDIGSDNYQARFTPSNFDKATNTVTITIPINIKKANDDLITINRIITYDKNKITPNVTIEVEDYQIGYDKQGSNPDPNKIKLSVRHFGFVAGETLIKQEVKVKSLTVTGSPNWSVGDRLVSGNKSALIFAKTDANNYKISDYTGAEFADTDKITNGSAIGTQSGSLGSETDDSSIIKSRTSHDGGTDNPHTHEIVAPSNRFLRRRYVAQAFEGTTDTDVLAQDSTTVFGTQAGTDGLTPILTNPNVLLRTDDSTTVIDYTNSSTFVEVYEGNQPLNFWLAWNSATTYAVGDYVKHNDVYYKAKTAHSNSEPPNSTNWDVVSSRSTYTVTATSSTHLDGSNNTVNDLTVGSASYNATNSGGSNPINFVRASFADVSAMGVKRKATVTYTITAERDDGEQVEITIDQQIAKNIKGRSFGDLRLSRDPIVIDTNTHGTLRSDGTTALFSSNTADPNYESGDAQGFVAGSAVPESSSNIVYGVKDDAPAWSSSVTYAQDDFVTHSTQFYKSKVNSNSNHTPSGSSDAYWELVDDSYGTVAVKNGLKVTINATTGVYVLSNHAPAWSNSASYSTGAYVSHSSKYWKALSAHSNQTPSSSSAYWKEVIDTWETDSEQFEIRGLVKHQKAFDLGLIETQRSGSLEIGTEYKIYDYNQGDSFTGVGAGANTTGQIFTATGTTPTWTEGSELMTDIIMKKVLDVTKAKKGEGTVEGRLTNDPVVIVTGPEGKKGLDGGDIDYAGSAGDFQIMVDGVDVAKDTTKTEYVHFRASIDDGTTWGTTTAYHVSNNTDQTVTDTTEQFKFTIDDRGNYQFADENLTSTPKKIWNTDATEVLVEAIIDNEKAKEWGLIISGTDPLTIQKKYTISKNKVGAAAQLKLKRDPVVIPTNVRGDKAPDGTDLSFTQTSQNWTGEVQFLIRKDDGGYTTLDLFDTSADDFLQVEVQSAPQDGLRLRLVDNAGENATTSTKDNSKRYYLLEEKLANDSASVWTSTVEHTEFLITATMGKDTATRYGLGGSQLQFIQILDVARARAGAKAVEFRLTNDPVILATDRLGTKKPDGTAFDDTWADDADGNADVYFAGVKYDDTSSGGEETETEKINYHIVGQAANGSGSTDSSATISRKTQNGLTFQVNRDNGSYGFNQDDDSTYTGWDSDTETFTIVATITNALAKAKGIIENDATNTSDVTIDKVYTVSKAQQGAEGMTTAGKIQWNFKADRRTLAIDEVSSSVIELVTTSTGAVTVGVQYYNSSASTWYNASESNTTWQVVSGTDNKKVTIYAPLFYDTQTSANYSEVRITWTQDTKSIVHSIRRVNESGFEKIEYDSSTNTISKTKVNDDGTSISGESAVTLLVPSSGDPGESGSAGSKGTQGPQGDWADGEPFGDPDKVRSVTVSGDHSSDYKNNEIIEASGGGGSGFRGHLIVNGAGQVTGVGVLNGGSGYSSAPTITAPSQGAGQTFTAVLGTGDRSNEAGVKGIKGTIGDSNKGNKSIKGETVQDTQTPDPHKGNKDIKPDTVYDDQTPDPHKGNKDIKPDVKVDDQETEDHKGNKDIKPDVKDGSDGDDHKGSKDKKPEIEFGSGGDDHKGSKDIKPDVKEDDQETEPHKGNKDIKPDVKVDDQTPDPHKGNKDIKPSTDLGEGGDEHKGNKDIKPATGTGSGGADHKGSKDIKPATGTGSDGDDHKGSKAIKGSKGESEAGDSHKGDKATKGNKANKE